MNLRIYSKDDYYICSVLLFEFLLKVKLQVFDVIFQLRLYHLYICEIFNLNRPLLLTKTII